jgi:hypothetical protein
MAMIKMLKERFHHFCRLNKNKKGTSESRKQQWWTDALSWRKSRLKPWKRRTPFNKRFKSLLKIIFAVPPILLSFLCSTRFLSKIPTLITHTYIRSENKIFIYILQAQLHIKLYTKIYLSNLNHDYTSPSKLVQQRNIVQQPIVQQPIVANCIVCNNCT